MIDESFVGGSSKNFRLELPKGSESKSLTKKEKSVGSIIFKIIMIIVVIGIIIILAPVIFCLAIIVLYSIGNSTLPLLPFLALLVLGIFGLFTYRKSVKSKNSRYFDKFLSIFLFFGIMVVLFTAGYLHDIQGLNCSLEQDGILLRPISLAILGLITFFALDLKK